MGSARRRGATGDDDQAVRRRRARASGVGELWVSQWRPASNSNRRTVDTALAMSSAEMKWLPCDGSAAQRLTRGEEDVGGETQGGPSGDRRDEWKTDEARTDEMELTALLLLRGAGRPYRSHRTRRRQQAHGMCAARARRESGARSLSTLNVGRRTPAERTGAVDHDRLSEAMPTTAL